MKPPKTPRTFVYHAHGFAVSGMIKSPYRKLIPTQAMATLPTSGGHAEVTVPGFSHEDIVSFDGAHTLITGLQTGDNVYETDMKVTIKGLNIMDRFTATEVVTHIHCKHTLGAFGKEKQDRSEILPTESRFAGVRINGKPVEIILDHDFFKQYAHYNHFRSAYGKGPFRQKVKKQFHWVAPKTNQVIPDTVQTRYKWAERLADKLPENGNILCTLVKEIKGDLDGQVFGNMIVLPDFGTIYLADYFMEKHGRRLEMVRVKVDKPFKGTICDGGQGGGNGYPPSGG
jgi:hypothetical protein